MPTFAATLVTLAGTLGVLTACAVGPVYQRPTVPMPEAYKEMHGWKAARPQDDVPRSRWWEIFQDAQLNALAEQIDVSNQNIVAAEAQLRGARAAIRAARADLFPGVTVGPELAGARQSANRASGSSGSGDVRANYLLPIDVTYEPDIWGRLRQNVAANIASAQASTADLETVRLNLQADLTVAYFSLRGIDAQRHLLDATIAAFDRALELTTNRYNQGVVARLDVVQAQAQIETVRAQTLELGVQRAQLEHAVALLLGRSPAELTIPPSPITGQPPTVPAELPSELLERRPDIAAAERRVAAANAQIGVAQAAFFPTILLRAAFGQESTNVANLFSWPSVFWSLGASLTQVVFDAGRRRAIADEARAAYDANVAMYRQTVLSAFQSVEDNLAVLRILEETAQQQDKAVQAADTVLALALNRYKGGVTTYLEVITAQSTALAARRAAVDILTRRMTATALLIKALGGHWSAAVLDQSGI